MISADYLGGTNTTVTGVTGGGLTWVLRRTHNVQPGTAEIWRAFAPSPLTNVQVTATMSQAVDSSMTVVSFSNVDTSGTNGSGAIGAIAAANSLRRRADRDAGRPRATNSCVFGVGTDFDAAVARTVGANQTLVHQFLSPSGDTYWMQRTTEPDADLRHQRHDQRHGADRRSLQLVHRRDPGAQRARHDAADRVDHRAGRRRDGGRHRCRVTATASDNVGVAGVQFKLDGANLGAEDTGQPVHAHLEHDDGRQRHAHADRRRPRRGRQYHHVDRASR